MDDREIFRRDQTLRTTLPEPDIKTEPSTASQIRNCVRFMSLQPKKGKELFQDIKDKIDDIDDLQELIDDADNYNGETVLHTAVKCLQFKTKLEQDVVDLFIDNFPELIWQSRSGTDYEGQTPLHMAVCKGNTLLVKRFLDKLVEPRVSNSKKALLELKATGKIFHNTVMMGELPLTIAALTFNKDMVELLSNDEGTELDGTNSTDDNVCHSLIKYGRLYPDKKNEVMEMFRKLLDVPETQDTNNKNKRRLRRKLLTMTNHQGLNTLQLSVKLGFHEMFAFIMDQGLYCRTNFNDGLFDIKIYDVTELDAIAFMDDNDKSPKNSKTNQDNIPDQGLTKERENQSILMMLFDLDPEIAFQIIQFPPTRLIVHRKWSYYRNVVYPLGVFHFLFTCFLTWYCAERSLQHSNTENGYDVNLSPEYVEQIGKSPFVTGFGIISVLVGVFYVAQESVRIFKGKMPYTWKSVWNPYGCGFFRVFFMLFGIGLVLDFILAVSLDWYENYFLIVSVVLAWFLNTFFLRTIKYFSFFTVLMQNVLIGDMTRFFVIISFELMAFSTAMYMAIQGSNTADDPNYSNFGRVIFSMFSLTVGLGDAADFYQTRSPVLCILIFIPFVITTTLLMINALIAMMSETCTELVENVGSSKSHDRHTKLQRLSVILFLESILMTSFIFKVGEEEHVERNDTAGESRPKVIRYMLEMRSLLNEDDSESGEISVSPRLGFRSVINAIRYQQRPSSGNQRPSSGISDRVKNFFSRGKNHNNLLSVPNQTKVSPRADHNDAIAIIKASQFRH